MANNASSALRQGPTGDLVEKSFIHYLPIVIVGILICGVPSAIMSSAAGIYYPVVAQDFGVPVQDISLWRTLSYITGILTAPFAGVWLAKYNTKIILLVACVVESACLVSFGFAQAPWVMWIAGAIIGVTNTILLGVSISVLMNRWFRVNVGLLIGVCTAFTGLGAVVFIPIGQMLIDSSGWRMSYIILGTASLIIMFVACTFLLKSRPEDKGLLPYGTTKVAAMEAESIEEAEVASCVRPKVALKSVVFWLVMNTVVNLNSFFPSYVVWYNDQASVLSGAISAAFVTGATLSTITMAGNATGKIALGFFSDLSLKLAFLALIACGVLGTLFVWFFPATPLLPVGGFLFGCLVPGTLVIMPMFVRAVFGDGATFPILWGYVVLPVNLGGALGTYFWPLVADLLCGYNIVFALATGGLVATLIIGLIVYRLRDSLPKEHITEEDLENL